MLEGSFRGARQIRCDADDFSIELLLGAGRTAQLSRLEDESTVQESKVIGSPVQGADKETAPAVPSENAIDGQGLGWWRNGAGRRP